MRNGLHVTGIRLKKTFLPGKKRLLIRTVFVLIDVKTERSTCAKSTCFLRSIYLHVSAVFITRQKSLGWSITSKRKKHSSS